MKRYEALEKYQMLLLELEKLFDSLLEYREVIEDIKGVNGDTRSMEVDWDLRYMQYETRREAVFEFGKSLGV